MHHLGQISNDQMEFCQYGGMHSSNSINFYTASNEDSRCSSSMGYLEPRPSSQSPPNNQVFSPKDIQKKLMEKVANINSEHNSEGGGGSKEAESAVAMENLPNSGSAGHSSQPVSKGLSLGSLFRR